MGLLIAALIAWAALGTVPGLRPALGLPAGYKFSFLRWGAMYSEARPGALLWGSPRRRSSWAFATAGESIVLSSTSTIDRGRIVLSVRQGLITGPSVHVEHIASSGWREIRVPVPESGFYTVASNYVFRFRGRQDLSWRVE